LKKLFSKVNDWQHWPFFPFYFPLFFVWAWYILKSRSVWFFSTSNPTLTFGGFEGESKKEMYDLLPQKYFPKTIYVNPKQSFQEVLDEMQALSFSYPVIVKPDVGMEGILFRKINNQDQFEIYHSRMPVDYLLQEFIDQPMEIGLFYFRHPQNDHGKISALFEKKFPSITGDGFSTVQQLLQKENIEMSENGKELNVPGYQSIPEKNEVIKLSFVGNRYHGTTFHDLSDSIDKELLQIFDEISHATSFYYGRYDIKCSSIEELKKGNNFSILEFNGAGSIPNHVYTGKFSMWQAYKEIAYHWKMLFEISSYNHRAGLSYWSLLTGARYLRKAKKHFRFLRRYDKQLIL
jgi:hypothetical protein